jgi:hypothetical protein
VDYLLSFIEFQRIPITITSPHLTWPHLLFG